MPYEENLHLSYADEQPPLSPPMTTEEVYNESLNASLMRNTGNYIVCEFLIGTNNLVEKEGFLFNVGINYITLYSPGVEEYTICDFYSLKFVTFIDYRKPRNGRVIPTPTITFPKQAPAPAPQPAPQPVNPTGSSQSMPGGRQPSPSYPASNRF